MRARGATGACLSFDIQAASPLISCWIFGQGFLACLFCNFICMPCNQIVLQHWCACSPAPRFSSNPQLLYG
jgi:hypothetical protein